MKKQKRLAIIPARGGSKRIPQKNIKDFLGKPIIAYSIQVALGSKLFDEVMVSTDDKEIVPVSKKYGAEVPFLRSKENSGDKAVLADVVEEVTGWYRKNGKEFDYICCVLPTAPLITAKNLSKGLKVLIDNDFNSVRPIIKFSYPIQKAFKFENNEVTLIDKRQNRINTQQLDPYYHDAGQFYWMDSEGIMDKGRRGGFEIKEIEAQDIDSHEDWIMAELKYKLINKELI